jgi:hypothetical protein
VGQFIHLGLRSRGHLALSCTAEGRAGRVQGGSRPFLHRGSGGITLGKNYEISVQNPAL